MKYVVKFGKLYSCGRPTNTDDGTIGLQVSINQSDAWVTTDREHAAEHAAIWAEDAKGAGVDGPRVVRVGKKS